MKTISAGFALLLFSAGSIAVHAAVVVNLGAGVVRSSATLHFAVRGSSVQYMRDVQNSGITLSERAVNGAFGSFAVNLSAAASGNDQDATMWKFGPLTADLDTKKVGWGVASPGDTFADEQMNGNEAVILRFDVSNLEIREGHTLAFSVLSDDGESYRIYRRTALNTGQVATTVHSSDSGFSNVVPVGGMLEYAIADAGHSGGKGMRITGIAFDVLPSAVTPAPVPENTTVAAKKRVAAKTDTKTKENTSGNSPSETLGLIY